MSTPATKALLAAISALEDEGHGDLAIKTAEVHLKLQKRLHAMPGRDETDDVEREKRTRAALGTSETMTLRVAEWKFAIQYGKALRPTTTDEEKALRELRLYYNGIIARRLLERAKVVKLREPLPDAWAEQAHAAVKELLEKGRSTDARRLAQHMGLWIPPLRWQEMVAIAEQAEQELAQ